MGSQPGRKYADWSTPEGWLLKDIIHILWTNGLRGDRLAARFKQIVPCYREVVGDVTDNAIAQRGDKGTREGNEFEHPDKHPVGIRFLDAAREVVNKNQSLDLLALAATIRENPVSSALSIPSDNAPITKSLNNAGYLYVLRSRSDSSRSALGISINPKERIDSFRKGDLAGELELADLFFVENPRRAETEIKQLFRDIHLGHERYDVPATTMVQMVRSTCDRLGLAHYIVKNKELVC